MTGPTEEERATMLAAASRLADAAETEVAAIGHVPGTSTMALLTACQLTLNRHGNMLEIAATLMEMAFESCGMEVDGKRMCEQLAAAASRGKTMAMDFRAVQASATATAIKH